MPKHLIYKFLIIAMALILSFSACGKHTSSENSNVSGSTSSEPLNTPVAELPTATPTIVPTTSPVPSPTPAPTFTPTPEPDLPPIVATTDEPSQSSDLPPAVVATDAPAHVPEFRPESTPEPVPSDTLADTTDWYSHMINSSILSTGTNGRLEKVMAKIKNDEPISIVLIGGSVTEGAGARNFTYSYGDQFINSLLESYPLTNAVYLNSGLGGTPSTLGLMRYKRDVIDTLGHNPDLVIVEFAVNDYEEPTNGRAYESLIRTIMEQENEPAVILLFSVFQSKWNQQSSYIPLGEHYGLPMISIKDAIQTAYSRQQLTDTDFFADIYHPTDYGHKIMADCLEELCLRVAQKNSSEPIAPLPDTAVYGNDFMNMHLITSQDNGDALVTSGSFNKCDSALQTYARTAKAVFPDNWMHTADSGNEAFRVELTCKKILLSYKYSNSSSFGKASVYIDGIFITELNGHLNGGWNNTETVLLLDRETAAGHILEIKMSQSHETKNFTVLGIGYSK